MIHETKDNGYIDIFFEKDEDYELFFKFIAYNEDTLYNDGEKFFTLSIFGSDGSGISISYKKDIKSLYNFLDEMFKKYGDLK